MNQSEEAILHYLKEQKNKPVTMEKIAQALRVPKKGFKRFRKMLKNLRRASKILRAADKTYRIVSDEDYIVGTLRKHPKGFGFLIPDDRKQEDVFLGPRQLMNIMNEAKLKVIRRESGKGGKERYTGTIVEVISRGSRRVLGKLQLKGRRAFVLPQKSESHVGAFDNIAIPFSPKLNNLRDNIVLCEITKFPRFGQHAQGKIIKVIGKPGKHAIDFSMMIHEFDLPHEFSKNVLRYADELKSCDYSDEIKRRKDLRQLPFMTIDGETAKDFDDAVLVKKLPNKHYRLWVAIADVSYFVKEGSPLDEEAYERATSVYFPGGVVPMLPEALSNDLCSLNPNEDKMTFCCEMEFDAQGNCLNKKIYEAVIRSQHRMTYPLVQKILDKDKEATASHKKIVPDILIMDELRQVLKDSRLRRGCLDFDLPEPELVLDLQGNIETILKRLRLNAHMLIEEFMIAANEATAEFMTDRKRPFIYRVHDDPDEEKVDQFKILAHNLGFPMKHSKKIHPKQFAELLARVEGKPAEHILNVALLRTMKMAVYTDENNGHFGLASNCYSHFTSPIRRYPDLIAHRLLKAELKKKSNNSDKIDGVMTEKIIDQAAHCSNRERNAEAAERQFVALKKAQFMEDKLGQEFVAYVSGVMDFGFFVELETFYVEGLVSLRSIEDDYYEFVPQHYYIQGRNSKNTYKLGQKVNVVLSKVDMNKRQIDFELVN